MGSRPIAPGAVLVLGGRSEIGVEVAARLAPGRVVVLAARRHDELEAERARIAAAGATAVHAVEFDADDITSHPGVLAGVAERFGPIGVAVVAFGVLGDQARAEHDPAHAVAVVHTDYVAQVSVLTVLADLLRPVGGQMVVFSSIAGVRVRRANYVYGSAKAGLDGFASGLADSLHGSGVEVLVVRPGFVVGRMTAGMSPAPFASTPAQVADAVVDALRSHRRSVWVPRAIGVVAAVFRALPGWVWRRLPR